MRQEPQFLHETKPEMKQCADPTLNEEQLAWLADALAVDVASEDLAALANQLALLEELETSALLDVPPALKLDAAWHD